MDETSKIEIICPECENILRVRPKIKDVWCEFCGDFVSFIPEEEIKVVCSCRKITSWPFEAHGSEQNCSDCGEKIEIPLIDISTDDAPSPSLPLLPDGYDYAQMISYGSQGIVWRVLNRNMSRQEACKILLGMSEQEKRRFHQEIKTIAALNHLNIVTIYYANPQESYFIMEYLPAGSFSAFMEGANFSLAQGIRFLIQVAEGLHCAHCHGLVHRDLKPDNILFSKNMVPKITDFGIVKKGKGGMTVANSLLGTPEYMAPEQWKSPTEVDHRCDIWSLGIILYQILTGTLPFPGIRGTSLMYPTLVEPIPSPTSVNSSLAIEDKVIESICLKALSKEKQKRYASALEMANELRRFLTEYHIVEDSSAIRIASSLSPKKSSFLDEVLPIPSKIGDTLLIDPTQAQDLPLKSQEDLDSLYSTDEAFNKTQMRLPKQDRSPQEKTQSNIPLMKEEKVKLIQGETKRLKKRKKNTAALQTLRRSKDDLKKDRDGQQTKKLSLKKTQELVSAIDGNYEDPSHKPEVNTRLPRITFVSEPISAQENNLAKEEKKRKENHLNSSLELAAPSAPEQEWEERNLNRQTIRTEFSKSRKWRPVQYAFVVSVFLLGFSFFFFLFYQSWQAQRFYQLGQEKGNTPSSITQRVEYLERAISYKRDSLYLKELARAYLEQEKNQAAYDILKSLEKEGEEYLTLFALAAQQLSLWNEVQQALEPILAQDNPVSWEVYTALGQAYFHQESYSQARVSLEKAIEMNPQALEYNLLAQVYQKLGKWGLAISSYEKLNQLSFSVGTLYLLLDLYRNLEEHKSIVLCLERILPESSDLKETNLLDLWLKSKKELNVDYEEKSFALSKIQEENKERNPTISLYALNLLGKMHKEASSYTRALESYQEIIKVQPDNQEAIRELLPLLRHFSKWRELYKLSENLLKKEASPQVSFYFVESCIALSKLSQARRILEESPESDQKWVLKAQILNHEGEPSQAILVCREGVALYPISQVLLNYLGYLLFQGNHYHTAMEVLHQSQELSPNSEAEYYLAKLYLKVGFLDLAKTYLKQCQSRKSSLYAEQAKLLLRVWEKGSPVLQSNFLRSLSEFPQKTPNSIARLVAQDRALSALIKLANNEEEEGKKVLASFRSVDYPQKKIRSGGILFEKEALAEEDGQRFLSILEESILFRWPEWKIFLLGQLPPEKRKKLSSWEKEYTKKLKEKSGSEKAKMILQGVIHILTFLDEGETYQELAENNLRGMAFSSSPYQDWALLYKTIGEILFSVSRYRYSEILAEELKNTYGEYKEGRSQARSLLEQIYQDIRFIQENLQRIVIMKEIGF